LDDVFHSWWFLLSVALFSLNLVLCTVNRFTLFLKNRASEALPKESYLSALALTFFRPGPTVEEVSRLFAGYRTVLLAQQGAILERGRFAQYGVFIIHASILLILLGGLVGLLFGFKGSLNLPVGEARNTLTLTEGPEPAHKALGFTIKCVDFRVSFYDNGQPKEFVSSLEVLENDRVVLKKDVRVNDPLTYKGISFYQATYGNDPVFEFLIGGKSVLLHEGGTFRQGSLTLMVVRFAESVHDFGPGVQVAYLDQGEPKVIWFLRDVPRLREQTISGVPIKLEAMKEQRYTGIEVSRDPGLWFVWCGFFLLMCGLCINFGLYHRRVYLVQKDGGVMIAGTSRRNKEAFKREFERLKERLNAQR
jgi:cytochrome c biogenesis protein